jgi:hypothetical protein
MYSTTILWTCTVPACPVGNVIPDEQGQSAHQSKAGHTAVLGQPVAWVYDRDAFTGA